MDGHIYINSASQFMHYTPTPDWVTVGLGGDLHKKFPSLGQFFGLRVMRLLLNINFSGVIVILAYKPTITFQFHFMVIISDEYKYKGLVKTTFKSPMSFEIYHTRN